MPTPRASRQAGLTLTNLVKLGRGTRSLTPPTAEECAEQLRKIARANLEGEKADKEAQFAAFIATLDVGENASPERRAELDVYRRRHEAELAALRAALDERAHEAASEVLPYVISASSPHRQPAAGGANGTMAVGPPAGAGCCYFGAQDAARVQDAARAQAQWPAQQMGAPAQGPMQQQLQQQHGQHFAHAMMQQMPGMGMLHPHLSQPMQRQAQQQLPSYTQSQPTTTSPANSFQQAHTPPYGQPYFNQFG